MPSYLTNPGDWVKISLIAFAAVILVNKALDSLGGSEFKV